MHVQFGTHAADFTIVEGCDVIGGALRSRHEVIYGTAVMAGDANTNRRGRVPGVTDEAITRASAGARRARLMLGLDSGDDDHRVREPRRVPEVIEGLHVPV